MEEQLKDTTQNPRGFGGTSDPEVATNDDGDVKASPDEQMGYDLLTVRSRKMMFGKGREKILKLLGTGESPAKAMGQAGSMLIKSLMESSKQAGREISPETAINAATEIVEDLNDLAKANKVFQYDTPEDEQKELEEAMLWGVKFYGDGMIKSGEISPDMQKMAKQQVTEGLQEEQAKGPKKTPIAAGVGEAMTQAPGLVGGAMSGGV